MNTDSPATPVHGGDAARIAARYGVSADTLLDFSANINPLGPPSAVLALLADEAWMRHTLGAYPDREATVLKDVIAARFGVSHAAIAVANGGAALIDGVFRSLPPSRVLVPVPAFSEYARAIAANGHEMVRVPLNLDADCTLDAEDLTAAIRAASPSVVIITSPHNPSGSLVAAEALRRIRTAANALGCLTIVDEAFIDYVPHASLLAEAETTDGLVVLRSLTKFYAMPALRVGFALAMPALVARITAFLPSWPVTTLALEAGARALGDVGFDDRSIAVNAASRAALTRGLEALGIRVMPSAANFLLIEAPPSWPSRRRIYERLIRQGIVVRDCGDYDGVGERRFFRVAVRSMVENERLVAALAASRTP